MNEHSFDSRFDHIDRELAVLRSSVEALREGQAMVLNSVNAQAAALNDKVDSLAKDLTDRVDSFANQSAARDRREHAEVTSRLAGIEKAIVGRG